METVNPSHLSIDALRRYAVGGVFIETGTFMGETVELVLQSGLFETIHTIELNLELHQRALEKFKDFPQVVCHFGDSVEILPKLLETYQDEEVTIWLDAHASGELVGGKTGPSPLIEELKAIAGMNLLVFRNGNMVPVPPKIRTHTIFIDDRRLLGTAEWGFVQENSVAELLHHINPGYNLRFLDGHIPNDVIVASRRDGVLTETHDVEQFFEVVDRVPSQTEEAHHPEEVVADAAPKPQEEASQ